MKDRFMTEFEIRFYLVAAMSVYAYVTTTWGWRWRTWFLWAEYIVGALFIVGATAQMWDAGVITSIADYQKHLVLNYSAGGAPVIVAQMWHAIKEADEARKRRSEEETHDVPTTRGA
jgi:hypothetical protein